MSSLSQHDIIITEHELEGDLTIPENPKAVILFAHGSGSGKHSMRNNYVAEMLNRAGFGTLLVDLLNSDEKKTDNLTKHFRYDVGLLSSRMISITEWLKSYNETSKLNIGYFGSSTGAAACLNTALRYENEVKAIVSRGGRPDLAESNLGSVKAATLFIAGGLDNDIIEISRRALNELRQTRAKELVIIPGAGHLFEEIGKMEVVADAAANWFECYLGNGMHFENKYGSSTVCKGIADKLKSRMMPQIKFKDRVAAAEILANLLTKYKKQNPTIIGIPRGGVVLAEVIARILAAPLDVVVSKKIRSPSSAESALGAISQDDFVYLDEDLIASLGISKEYLSAEILEQKNEVHRRLSSYRRQGKGEYNLKNRTVILVDDGAATGSTLIASARWLRNQKPLQIVIALPVASRQLQERLRHEADEVHTITAPKKFKSVSEYYLDYNQVSDERIMELLENGTDFSSRK